MLEYDIILLGLMTISVFLHRLFRVKLFSSKRHLILFYLIFITVGTIWDQYAIARGHWSYKPQFISNIYIGYMPIEDFAFSIFLSYFGLVLYRITERYSD